MKNSNNEFCFILSTDKQQSNPYYQLPKSLFVDNRLISLSPAAKVLYSVMLDRIGLSLKNGFFDRQNRVFIYMTIDEVMQLLNCAKQKACKLMKELNDCGLIISKRQGYAKPNIIYVKQFKL